MSQTFVYDPTTTRFQEEMHDVYRVLRDDYPVYVSPDGTYVLSRFADVWGAVHDWRAFSVDVRRGRTVDAADDLHGPASAHGPARPRLACLHARAGGRARGPDAGRWPGSCSTEIVAVGGLRPGARRSRHPSRASSWRPDRRTRRAPRRLPPLDRGVPRGDQSGRHRAAGRRTSTAVRRPLLAERRRSPTDDLMSGCSRPPRSTATGCPRTICWVSASCS